MRGRLDLYPGLSLGPAGPAAADPLESVTMDATSGIYCPSTAEEWAGVLSAAGVTGTPAEIWLCQDASGNLVEAIDGTPVLAAAGAPLYQQSVTGWSRKAVEFAQYSDDRFVSTDSALPDTATEDTLVLAYMEVLAGDSSGYTLAFLGCSAALTRFSAIDNERLRFASVDGASDPRGAVRPFLAQIPAGGNPVLCTDQEVITSGSVASGRDCRIGAQSGVIAAASSRCLYFAVLRASTTAGQRKSLLETLGWTVGWTP